MCSALLDNPGGREGHGVETNNERRARKLRGLVDKVGGYDAAAAPAGLSSVYLEQILKGVLLPLKKGERTRSPRSLGDAAARALEEAHGLERGWFDNDEGEAMLSPMELRLLGYFRELDKDAQTQLLDALHHDHAARGNLRRRLMRGVSVVAESARREPAEAGVRGRSGFGALDEAQPRKRGAK
jgi:hypothetical protein